MAKKFILTADHLGTSKAVNRGVLESLGGDLLKSISVVSSGDFFNEVVETILPKCEGIGVGIELNITKGKPVCKDLTALVNANGEFDCPWYKLLLKLYNPKEKDFMPEVEREFRRQIESLLSKTKISHITSLNNVHMLPGLFKLVCRLAGEYKIPYVRSNYEKFYIVPDVFKHFHFRYLKNFLRSILLNLLTVIGEPAVQANNIKTNDYVIGGIYEGMMDSLAVSYGISSIRYKNFIAECVICPCRYDEGTIDEHFNEFLITKNKKLKEKLDKLEFEITKYEPEEQPQETEQKQDS